MNQQEDKTQSPPSSPDSNDPYDRSEFFKPGIIFKKEEGKSGPVLKLVQNTHGEADDKMFKALEEFLICLSEYSIKIPTKYAFPNKKPTTET